MLTYFEALSQFEPAVRQHRRRQIGGHEAVAGNGQLITVHVFAIDRQNVFDTGFAPFIKPDAPARSQIDDRGRLELWVHEAQHVLRRAARALIDVVEESVGIDVFHAYCLQVEGW